MTTSDDRIPVPRSLLERLTRQWVPSAVNEGRELLEKYRPSPLPWSLRDGDQIRGYDLTIAPHGKESVWVEVRKLGALQRPVESLGTSLNVNEVRRLSKQLNEIADWLTRSQ